MIARITPPAWTRWVLPGIAAAILLGYPLVFGTVYTNIFIHFAIFAVFAASLNMLVSYTGLLSFGHALFFGGGAYATALALENIPGMGLFPAIFTGGLAGAAFALIVSPLLNRVRDTAFALLTLALGQLAYMACIKLRDITHGEDGVGGFPIPDLSIPGVVSVSMVPAQNFYYLAIVILGICLLLMWFLTKTPFGSIMIGIRDNPQRVDFLGFNIPLTKCLIFTLSGFFAGIAGSVYALFNNLVTPDGVFHIMTSFTPIMMVYVGGIGTFAGPIAGSGLMTIIEEIATRYTTQLVLFNGILLVLVVMFFRTGFVGLYLLLKQKL
ncbi:MAG: branched-chain amino acid ABC transporter permease, partial [Desulfobacterales bacterium]|nr:branched-chain amino acid ABC transporter permease [Desulfobacterales bacterium]